MRLLWNKVGPNPMISVLIIRKLGHTHTHTHTHGECHVMMEAEMGEMS